LALVTLPLSFALVSVVIKASQKYFKQHRFTWACDGHVEEMYGGIPSSRPLTARKKSIQTFDKLNEELYSVGWKSQFLSGLMMPMVTFVGNLAYVAVSILGGYLAVQGTIGSEIPGIHPVRAVIHYADHAGGQHLLKSCNLTAAAAERVFGIPG